MNNNDDEVPEIIVADSEAVGLPVELYREMQILFILFDEGHRINTAHAFRITIESVTKEHLVRHWNTSKKDGGGGREYFNLHYKALVDQSDQQSA